MIKDVFIMAEPRVHGGLGVGNQLVSVCTADMAIHGHGCTDGTAEQLVDRGPEQFPLDIPQCNVHRGDGAREHRAALVEIAAVHPPPVVAHGAGVLADEVFGQRFDRRATERTLPSSTASLHPSTPASVVTRRNCQRGRT